MKWLIASDIHGSAYYCRELLESYEREQADRLLLLGDLLYHGPRNDLPKEYEPKQVIAMLNRYKNDILCVRGNCEAEVDQMVLEFPVMADYAILTEGTQTIFVTHGHLYNNANLPPLQKGDILLHGHTHIPACEKYETYVYCNPGSVALPKDGYPRGYMILENGQFLWKTLEGEVYQTFSLKQSTECLDQSIRDTAAFCQEEKDSFPGFRKMRRQKQQISQEECEEILRRNTHGVLGLAGDNGYPYTVPVSYVYEAGQDGKPGTIGFHCARSGHKIDSIQRLDKVSFCVVDRDEVMPKERTTKYISVIAFGKARFLETEEEMRTAANKLGARFSAGYEDLYMAETEDALRSGSLCCVEISIEHLTGKVGMQVLAERGMHL